ncbi:MAG: orotidine-5'-phosphate decarboxylase [Deltaproteobacteria bacterium]|nr:orotidine-5'-phosphate decarboxylase [Deltaproteobacteria bacterium]MBW2257960.1 orotidine-5'-phosphate decarboxylase [Deltaproteobacteria bacterium]
MSGTPSSFPDRLAAAVRQTGVPACVGLDPHPERLPEHLAHGLHPADAARAFCLDAIEAVAGVVPAVKPQVAFFEALGSPGLAALEAVVRGARDAGLLVILDAKRGDIGSTAEAYARGTLDDAGPLGCDAVTLSPYLGPESLTPFLARCDREGKGVFVLVRTSNPGAEAWQVAGPDPVADRIGSWVEAESARRAGDHGLGPVGAVIAATVPAEAAHWRALMPHSWFLVPGFGAQGGGVEDVRALFRDDGLGALIVSARGVLFPPGRTADPDWKKGIAIRARGFAQQVASLGP